MSHRWEDIRGKFSPEAEEAIQKRIENEPVIQCIRKAEEAHRLTVQALDANQDARPKLGMDRVVEADLYVSSLRGFLHAVGAKLEIRAVFPDGEVVIEQFEDLDRDRSGPDA
jgi:hypothetical protein